MKKEISLIGDKGLVRRTDNFGIMVIIICNLVTLGLAFLGVMALIN